VEYSRGGYITHVYGAKPRQLDTSARNAGPATPRKGWLVLGGVGTVYNLEHPAYGCDWLQDVFASGCFTKFLASGRNTAFHRMHQHGKAYGGTGDESLALVDTHAALLFKLKVDETDAAAVELFDQVANRSLSGASVGFGAMDFVFRDLGDGKKTRVVVEAWLGEISAVDRPAVPGSTTSAIDERVGRLQLGGFERLTAFASECAAAQLATNLRRLRDIVGGES
jgi:HK97 family phage prohead protease